MSYTACVKALYDYDAQDPETELSFKEDQILYIIEKEDDDWWKGKLKDPNGGAGEGPVGLIPATYVEQLPPLQQTRAIYAYESTSPEELSMHEDAVLHVFSAEEDWLLVRVEGGSGSLGFVPRNYCEAMEHSAQVEVADAADGAAEVEAAREVEVRQREVAEKQRQAKLKDRVETWSVSEMDGKKKKKGTLGVGNGAVFFASDTDKSPVKQYLITKLDLVSQPSSKNLQLTFGGLAEPLLFHCGGSDTVSEILAKLESSKAAAGEALELAAADSAALSEGEDDHETGAAAGSKTVRWAAAEQAPTSAASATTATVLYDFDAQGEDELTVHEAETVTVVDRENEEWWTVRNEQGGEGVVPAQYVQLNDGSAPSSNGVGEVQDDEDDGQREEEEAAAAAALDAGRQRDGQRKVEQRRAIESAARERSVQETADREYAEELQRKEEAKRERRETRRADEVKQQREVDAESRREQARRLEPPKISKRPSAQNVTAAAASLPSRGRNVPDRPAESNRPKPHGGRVRIWSDKSGQFKVEAEYLGLNGNKIRLHKVNGVIIEVPIDKMSPEDVQLIKRHEQRRQRAALEDDEPLGRVASKRSSGPSSRAAESDSRSDSRAAEPRPAESRSSESVARASPPIPAAAMEMPKPRKVRFDWFKFFLEAGCDMDDCTRYSTNFERDRMEGDILEDLDGSTLRSLGLKEGDIIRVKKAINNKFAKKTPEQDEQIKQDEDYAKELQEHENSGRKGPVPQPPPGLFTGADGKLSNRTRRGRPDKKNTGSETVDAAAVATASDQLSRVSISSPSPPSAESPPPKKAAPLIAGFDDDAWTIKPSSKPASPAPPALAQPPVPSASVPLANTTESLLAQIQSLRPASTGIGQNNTGGSFDAFSQMIGQTRAPSAPAQQQSYTGSSGGFGQYGGLGVQNTGMPMGQLQNAPRGPVAPVASNEALLNPLQPVQTGFIPTNRSAGQQGMMPQQTGYMVQQQQPMMMQPTGYAQGFQAGYGGQPQQIQPSYTGFPGGSGQQSQQNSFNAVANMPPPQQQQAPDKFAPSNIFAAMKKTEFGKPEDERPQDANKYDSLRPLTTGYNGAPGMVPQQTGFQQPGMGMGMGMGGGMMPQMTAQTTGYNPQMGMGYMGQQQGYGQQQQQGYGQQQQGYGQGYR